MVPLKESRESEIFSFKFANVSGFFIERLAIHIEKLTIFLLAFSLNAIIKTTANAAAVPMATKIMGVKSVDW